MQQRSRVQHGLRALGLGLAFVASSALAAVGVNKTFNPINVSAGQISTLTVFLLNNNASAATGTAFTDSLPGTVVVANPANATTSCGGAVTATSGRRQLLALRRNDSGGVGRRRRASARSRST